jgi:hypothetical protein
LRFLVRDARRWRCARGYNWKGSMVVVRVGEDGWDQHGGATNAFLQPIVAAVL